jgi:hypothetical protein
MQDGSVTVKMKEGKEMEFPGTTPLKEPAYSSQRRCL